MKNNYKKYCNVIYIVIIMAFNPINIYSGFSSSNGEFDEVKKAEDKKIPVCESGMSNIKFSENYDLLNLEELPEFESAFKVGGIGISQIGGIAADAEGNIYITGGFTGSINFNTQPVTSTLVSKSGFDYFLAKYNKSGNCLWVRRAEGAADLPDSVSVDGGIAIAVDKAGNIYTGGAFVRSLSFFDGNNNIASVLSCADPSYTNLELFVAKHNTNGDLLWTQGGNSGSHGDASLPKTSVNGVTSIILDGEELPYIGGRFSGSNFLNTNVGLEEDGDFFLAALDPDNGEVVWGDILGTEGEDGVVSLALDVYGYINALGYMGKGSITFPTEDNLELTNVNDRNDTFIAKYDVNGNCLWADLIGGEEDIIGEDIATDTLGNIFITGYFKGTATFTGSSLELTSAGDKENGYIAKYDFNGNAMWARKFGDNFFSKGGRIAVDEIGNSFVLGVFDSSIVFGSENPASQVKLLTNTFVDMFVAGYDSSGNFIWTKKIEDCGYGGINQISTSVLRVGNNPLQLSYSSNNGGELLMAGDFNNRMILDNIALDAPDGSRYSFIGKLQVAGAATSINENPELSTSYSLLQNYPNPFNPSTTITYNLSSQSYVSLKVFDILGKEIKSLVNENKPAGLHTVNFISDNLTSGIYFYTLNTPGFTQSKKMILLK